MLVLSRRIGESIIINDNIKVMFLGLHGNQGRIGIEAPEEIPIHRQEIQTKINQEKLKDKIELISTELKTN